MAASCTVYQQQSTGKQWHCELRAVTCNATIFVAVHKVQFQFDTETSIAKVGELVFCFFINNFLIE